MKRIISCLLILTLLLCMVGCFGEDKPSGSEKESILPSQGETGSQETVDEATGEEIDGSSTEQNSTAGTTEGNITELPSEPNKTDLPSYAALCSIEPGMTKEEVLSIAGSPQREEICRVPFGDSSLPGIDRLCYFYESSDGQSICVIWEASELFSVMFGVDSNEKVVKSVLELNKTDLPSYVALCSIEPGMTREEVFSIAGNPQTKEIAGVPFGDPAYSSHVVYRLCYSYDSSDGQSAFVVWGPTSTSFGGVVETVEKIVQE